jgi:hypothetical protein
VRKLQERTESWNVKGWNLKQIRDKVNGFFRRKDIGIAEIHITSDIFEIKYYDLRQDKMNENKRVNPSKRY